MTNDLPNWGEFERGVEPQTNEQRSDFASLCAGLFASGDGRKFIKWMRGVTKERVLGPEASESALRALEGQRQFCAQVEQLIAEGSKAKLTK